MEIMSDTISGLLFSGRMADIYGRRKLYLIGHSIYFVSTILTGAVKVSGPSSCPTLPLVKRFFGYRPC